MTNQDKGNQSLGLSLTNRLALERTRIAKGLMQINRFVVIKPAILLASITASDRTACDPRRIRDRRYTTSTGSTCLRCREKPPGPLIKMRRERLKTRLDTRPVNHLRHSKSFDDGIRP